MNDSLGHYRQRDAMLRGMGFASYREYLDSPLWSSLRERTLARDGGKCAGCGKPARQVHHTKYSPEVLSGEDISTLRAICGGCHRGIEFDHNGKATPRRANQKLRLKRKRRAKTQCAGDTEYQALAAMLSKAKAIVDREERRREVNRIRIAMRKMERIGIHRL